MVAAGRTPVDAAIDAASDLVCLTLRTDTRRQSVGRSVVDSWGFSGSCVCGASEERRGPDTDKRSSPAASIRQLLLLLLLLTPAVRLQSLPLL